MTAARTFTVLAAGASALALSAGAASAQYGYGGQYGRAPTGSFTGSCRNVQVLDNGYVSAECRTQGGYRWSTIRYVDCRSDLANRDGVLSCIGPVASVGPFYPEQAVTTSPLPAPGAAPGGVFGALLGAVFGDLFGDEAEIEREWERGGRPFGQRRERLEARLEAGIRDGSIDRGEAIRLRAEFDELARLESRYAAVGGLSMEERSDLRRRYRALAQRLGAQREDDYRWGDDRDRDGRWRSVRDREAALEARIEARVRDRTLDWREAAGLRADLQALVRLEARYASGGLNAEEREELDVAFRQLERRVDGRGDWRDDDWRDDDRGEPNWRPIIDRSAEFEARLDAAVRARRISASQASRLRGEFRDLVRLEADWRSGGLTAAEGVELNRRYSDLLRPLGGAGVDDDRWDDDRWSGGYGGGAAGIEARIAAGERSGAISRSEAARLRAELGDLVRLEAAYASDGLNAAERDYVSRRFAELDARVAAIRR